MQNFTSFYYYNITHSAFGISFKINSDIFFKNSVYSSEPKKKRERKKMGYFQPICLKRAIVYLLFKKRNSNKVI